MTPAKEKIKGFEDYIFSNLKSYRPADELTVPRLETLYQKLKGISKDNRDELDKIFNALIHLRDKTLERKSEGRLGNITELLMLAAEQLMLFTKARRLFAIDAKDEDLVQCEGHLQLLMKYIEQTKFFIINDKIEEDVVVDHKTVDGIMAFVEGKTGSIGSDVNIEQFVDKIADLVADGLKTAECTPDRNIYYWAKSLNEETEGPRVEADIVIGWHKDKSLYLHLKHCRLSFILNDNIDCVHVIDKEGNRFEMSEDRAFEYLCDSVKKTKEA